MGESHKKRTTFRVIIDTVLNLLILLLGIFEIYTSFITIGENKELNSNFLDILLFLVALIALPVVIRNLYTLFQELWGDR